MLEGDSSSRALARNLHLKLLDFVVKTAGVQKNGIFRQKLIKKLIS